MRHAWPLRTLGLAGAVALRARPDCTPRELLELARCLAVMGPGRRSGVRPIAQMADAVLGRGDADYSGQWTLVSDVAAFVLQLGGTLDERLPDWACAALRAYVAGGWRNGGGCGPRHPWVMARQQAVRRAAAEERERRAAAAAEQRKGGR